MRSERGDFSCKSPSAARPDKGSIKRTAFLPLFLPLPSSTPSTRSFALLSLSLSPCLFLLQPVFFFFFFTLSVLSSSSSVSRVLFLEVLVSRCSTSSLLADLPYATRRRHWSFLDFTPSASRVSPHLRYYHTNIEDPMPEKLRSPDRNIIHANRSERNRFFASRRPGNAATRPKILLASIYLRLGNNRFEIIYASSSLIIRKRITNASTYYQFLVARDLSPSM